MSAWRLVRDTRGITLTELLVAVAIFLFVVFGLGSLYLTTRDGFSYGSAEAFVQRQGTLIEEELARHILRATQIQVAQCRPSGSVTIPANESMLYQLKVQNPGTGALEDQFWCLYRFQRTVAVGGVSDPYPQLWRCQLAGILPPQTCTTTPENLLLPVPAAFANQQVNVSSANFCLASDAACMTTPVAGPVATTVNLRFDLELRAASGTTLLWAARRFGLNTTMRN